MGGSAVGAPLDRSDHVRLESLPAQPTAKGALCLEDFDLVEKLGKGSFGTVFLVKKKDDPNNKFLAMKILEKEKVLAQNLIRYAKTERNVLFQVKH